MDTLSRIKVYPKISSFVSAVYTQGCQSLSKKQTAFCLGVITALGAAVGTARYLRSNGYTDLGTTLSHIMNFVWRRNAATSSSSTTPKQVKSEAASTPQPVRTGTDEIDQEVSTPALTLVLTDRPQPKASFIFEQATDSAVQASIMEAIDKIKLTERESFINAAASLFNKEMSNDEILRIVQALAAEPNLYTRNRFIQEIKKLFLMNLTNEDRVCIAEHIVAVGIAGVSHMRSLMRALGECGFNMTPRFLCLFLSDLKDSQKDCILVCREMLTCIDQHTESLYDLYNAVKNKTAQPAVKNPVIDRVKKEGFRPLASPTKSPVGNSQETDNRMSADEIKGQILGSFGWILKDDEETAKLADLMALDQLSIDYIFDRVNEFFSGMPKSQVSAAKNVYDIFKIAIEDVKESIKNNRVFQNAADLFLSHMDFVDKKNILDLLKEMNPRERANFTKQAQPLIEEGLESTEAWQIVHALAQTPKGIRHTIVEALKELFKQDFNAEQKVIIIGNIFAIGLKDLASMNKCKDLMLFCVKEIDTKNSNLCLSSRFLTVFFEDFIGAPQACDVICKEMVKMVDGETGSPYTLYEQIKNAKGKDDPIPLLHIAALRRNVSFNRLDRQSRQPFLSPVQAGGTPK